MLAGVARDVRAVLQRDPAAGSALEAVLFSPGLHAVWGHRIAHWLWRHGMRLTARMLSLVVRAVTGVEIHPGARIGRSLFIDHGMGVVIGETSEIGDDVTMYHGATLGATVFVRGKRHPTVEDGVVIGAGAKVLGPVTIGRGARVGANAVVVRSVPAHAVVVGVPGRIVDAAGSRAAGGPGVVAAGSSGHAAPTDARTASRC